MLGSNRIESFVLNLLPSWCLYPVGSIIIEKNKIRVLRFGLAGLALYRLFHLLEFAPNNLISPYQFYVGLGVAAIMVLMGLGVYPTALPIVSLITYVYFENSVGIFTLGTNFLVMGLGLVACTSYVIKRAHETFSEEDHKALKIIYLGIFFYFFLLNASAALGHMMDPYWRSGSALSEIFLNPFYSTHYGLFRRLSDSSPEAYQLLCRLGTWSQLAFQLTMLCLSFGRRGAKLVLLWGLCFFVSSLFLFQLSYLPYIEITLWTLFFFKGQLHAPQSSSQKIPLPFTRFLIWFFVLSSLAFTVFMASVAGLMLTSSGDRFSTIKSDLLGNHPVLKVFGEGLKYVGIYPPNVFNSPDIEAGKKWVNIKDEHGTLVKLYGVDGERLSLHHSDALYYKVSIPLRRCLRLNALSGCAHLIQEAIGYHQRVNGVPERPTPYTIESYAIEDYKNYKSKKLIEASTIYQ